MVNKTTERTGDQPDRPDADPDQEQTTGTGERHDERPADPDADKTYVDRTRPRTQAP